MAEQQRLEQERIAKEAEAERLRKKQQREAEEAEEQRRREEEDRKRQEERDRKRKELEAQQQKDLEKAEARKKRAQKLIDEEPSDDVSTSESKLEPEVCIALYSLLRFSYKFNRNILTMSRRHRDIIIRLNSSLFLPL